MDKFTNDIWSWPLWSQVLLLIILVMVARFWLGRLFSSVQLAKLTGWIPSRLFFFMKCLLASGLISWLIVQFCIGSNELGKTYHWGFYGRVLFVASTAYLTSLFTRYFA